MIRPDETLGGARSLALFLRRPITLDEARAILRYRFEHQAHDYPIRVLEEILPIRFGGGPTHMLTTSTGR